MTLQYTTVTESSFGKGIDARSAENQIMAGFVRDLVNADIVEGRIRKRTGYATYAGNLPLRVLRLKQTLATKQLCLTFDGSIDLSTAASCPILVSGKSSNVTSGQGPFTTSGDTFKWYPNWTTTLRKVFTAGTTGTITAPADEHGINTTQVFVGLAESTSNTNLSSRELLWGDNNSATDLTIDKTSKDILAGYVNNTATGVNTFLYYADKSTILTETYTQTWSVASSSSPDVHPISAATHQLANYNIIYQLWAEDIANNTWNRVRPQDFQLDSSSGDISVTTVNDTGLSVNYRIILTTVPPGNNNDYNITTGSNTITISGITSPFLFYNLYTISGITLTEVIPDEYIYNDVNKTWTLSFVNNTPSALIAKVYYDYGSVRVNELCVTDNGITADVTDTAPQLSVYGISHEIAYGENKKVNRRGWVTHIDSYRSPNRTHMVSGLGGNLFAALGKSDLTDDSGNYLPFASSLNDYYPKLNTRLLTATNIGPVFWDTNGAPPLTRGSITHDGGGTNWATVTGVTYQGNDITEYTLSTPNRVVTGNPVTIDQDWLTIKGMSHSKHNGEFLIKTVSYPTSYTMVIGVANTNITSSDYDDSNTLGLAGVFTDSIVTVDASPFLANDYLLSSFWGDETELVVIGTNGTTTTISQVYSYLQLGAGLVITGRRTSNLVPLRDPLNNSTVTNLVAGDTLHYSEFGRPLQVLSVDAANKTVTLDESFTWEDSLAAPATFTVARRWVPAESPTPDSGDNLLPTTVVRHLSSNDYDSQPFLRSAMVQNNMYLTNGDDEVYKYDGSSFYRAGIIPWQPGLFLTVQKTVADGLPLAGVTIAGIGGTNLQGKTIKLTSAQASAFANKDSVQLVFTNSTQSKTLYATVSQIVQETSGTNSYVYFEEPLNVGFTPTAISLTLVYQARYYFRLNIKDANGVTIASAVTGADDFVVQAVPTTTEYIKVRLRLVGLPAWDQYDFSNKNIELQVYRTLWSTGSLGEVPVFYRIATQACTFKKNNGYLDFTDVLSNDSLTDSDAVVGVLSPNTIPAAWDEPARAKYVTSAGNRLVLANVVDWPTLAVSYLTAGSIPAANYVGQKFCFKRTSAATGTTTNVNDIMTYELRSTSSGIACYPELSGSSGQFKVTLASLPSGLTNGDWVYLYHNIPTTGTKYVVSNVNTSTEIISATGSAFANGDLVYFTSSGTLPAPIVAGQGYFVRDVNNTDFKIAATYGGAAIDLTTSGSGTINVLSDGSELDYCGWWQVNSIVGNTLTIFDINSNITTIPTQFPDKALFATDPTNVPVLVDTDGNMGMANGNGPVAYNNILRRLGMAINTTMRVVSTTLPAYTTFVPWLVARSESDTGSQLIVKQPRADIESPTLEVIGGDNGYTTYVNGNKVSTSGTITKSLSLIRRYPSRILVSYNNYPEIFDNPWAVDDSLSDSAIDINSSDGQEITGIIPFFGESAFGAALQSGVLVVFKQNSIYLVDLSEKAAGKNPVQRIETQGLGCTAPYSIAPTKDGIAFANDSGIYRLRRDQRLEYLGRFMERNWKEKVDLDALALVQGHHYGVGRQYKLSVPLVSESLPGYAQNSEVYVYNHTNETADEPGGWGRYTNHPATGWANLFQDAFYANVNGTVKQIRALGDQYDYRDDNAAIEVILETRAVSFDQAGIRKIVSHVIVNYRTGGTSTSTTVSAAPDLYDQFDETTAFQIMAKAINDGFSTLANQDIVTIRHSLVRRKCVYMTIKIINTGIDEALEVAGMTFIVAGLTSKGIKQAAATKK